MSYDEQMRLLFPEMQIHADFLRSLAAPQACRLSERFAALQIALEGLAHDFMDYCDKWNHPNAGKIAKILDNPLD